MFERTCRCPLDAAEMSAVSPYDPRMEGSAPSRSCDHGQAHSSQGTNAINPFTTEL